MADRFICLNTVWRVLVFVGTKMLIVDLQDSGGPVARRRCPHHWQLHVC
jgi:hypothetical protein